MAEERIYTVIVKGQRVVVNENVYYAYHQAREAERYQNKVITRHERSLERFQEEGVNIEYQFASSQDFVLELVREDMKIHLRQALQTLTPEEQRLISELFFNNRSERELSKMINVPQHTINDRKRKILMKLRHLLEK